MKRRLFASIVVVFQTMTWAQTGSGGGSTATPATVRPIPETLRRGEFQGLLFEAFRALGGRLESDTKARVGLTGSIRDQGGSRPATITWQLPGLFRMTVGGSAAFTLVFDGNRSTSSRGQINAEEQKLMESLFADLPESVFHSLARGGGVRELGTRFRLDDGKAPNYAGPYIDFYRIVIPLTGPAARAIPQPAEKLVGFESGGQLLHHVTYRTGARTTVRTEYLDWRQSGSDRYPGQIVRTEDGKEVFRLVIEGMETGPKLQDVAFRIP